MVDVNILVLTPPKVEEQPVAEDLVWPTMLEDDEPEDTLIELTFYDYATWKDSSGNWNDIADWYNDDLMQVVWQVEKDFTDNKPFHVSPKSTTYIVHGNTDAKVRTSVIAEEFGEDNTTRWERKPLASRPSEWRFDGNRWYAGGTYAYTDPTSGASVIASDYSQFNIRCELLSSPDSISTATVDPDSYHDGKHRRLKLKFPQDIGEIRPLIYRGNFPGQRLGIKIKDQSKSFGHYVTGSGLGYAYDWLEGIYFCPFDTTDDTKFKITISPSFISDEVQGRFLVPGKYDVGLIPRRWMYEFRYHHQQNPKTDYEDDSYPGISDTCENQLDFYWHLNDNQAVKTQFTTGDPAVLRGYYAISTHHVAYFWGRWPCNFTAQWYHESGYPSAEDTAPVRFFDATHNVVGNVDLIWSETYAQAQANFISAGGDADEAAELLTGGLSCNLHVCSDSTGLLVKIGGASSTESWGSLYQIAHTSYGGPVVTRSANGYTYQGFIPAADNPNFGVKALWAVIEGTELWQNTIEPLRQKAIAMEDTNSAASRIDMIPWGVAVSPSLAGDLVGIIRQRGKAWFVWRKTDEEWEPKTVGAATNPIRFESAQSNGALGSFSEGDYVGETIYDADYCDLFIGDGARKITHVGREITSVTGDTDVNCTFLYETHAEGATEGAVQLPAPAYVMVTKERAFDGIDWTVYVAEFSGANTDLNGRHARCNEFGQQDAATRNSY